MLRTAITDDTELQRKQRMAGETKFGRFCFNNGISFKSEVMSSHTNSKMKLCLKSNVMNTWEMMWFG